MSSFFSFCPFLAFTPCLSTCYFSYCLLCQVIVLHVILSSCLVPILLSHVSKLCLFFQFHACTISSNHVIYLVHAINIATFHLSLVINIVINENHIHQTMLWLMKSTLLIFRSVQLFQIFSLLGLALLSISHPCILFSFLIVT